MKDTIQSSRLHLKQTFYSHAIGSVSLLYHKGKGGGSSYVILDNCNDSTKMIQQLLLLFPGNISDHFHIHTHEWEEDDLIPTQNNLDITMSISHLNNKTRVQNGMQVGG